MMNEEETMSSSILFGTSSLYCGHKDIHLIVLVHCQIKHQLRVGLYFAIKIPHISVLLINNIVEMILLQLYLEKKVYLYSCVNIFTKNT